MFFIALVQSICDMSWGAGLFFSVLVVCLVLLSFRLIELAACAVNRMLRAAGHAGTWVWSQRTALDMPSSTPSRRKR